MLHVRCRGIRVILGLYWGYIGVMLGLYWDNGKENGNYYSILGLYGGPPM